ncbi:mCpol domain-containing protein [Streptomyces sp. adm13(2018)]|uniref:mCpol domain-containing protein n=1 Tax=Streptomyces sp. adm13(2018) TaxID=2479007 RepID=UPI0011CDE40A|nr:mCpol domain-containing protein [Streptomyces sp. adm13(2018)]TXS20455.1 mCpol domain-containing protein [Streptomyces sp. adm13(2018)]
MPFAIIDGDDIGNKVESFILANDVANFIESSRRINFELEGLATRMKELPGVSLVHAGGDSLLIEMEDEAVGLVVEVVNMEQKPGSLTFSAGIGSTLRRSFMALRMAKSSGKCRVVRFEEERE